MYVLYKCPNIYHIYLFHCSYKSLWNIYPMAVPVKGYSICCYKTAASQLHVMNNQSVIECSTCLRNHVKLKYSIKSTPLWTKIQWILSNKTYPFLLCWNSITREVRKRSLTAIFSYNVFPDYSNSFMQKKENEKKWDLVKSCSDKLQ